MTIYVMFHNMFFMTIMDSAFFNIICFSFDGETRVYYFKKHYFYYFYLFLSHYFLIYQRFSRKKNVNFLYYIYQTSMLNEGPTKCNTIIAIGFSHKVQHLQNAFERSHRTS